MRALLLAFVAGCWLLQQQGALPAGRDWLLEACAVAMLACALAWVAVRPAAKPRKPRVTHARLAAGMVVALAVGFGWAAWRADLRLDRWLDPGMAGRDVVVDGIVAGLPDVAAHGTRFVFRVEGWPHGVVQDDDAARGRAMSARLQLTWRDAPDQLRPGQRHRLTVRLRRPRGLANPHGFDYAYWLLGEAIDATGYVRAVEPLPGMARKGICHAEGKARCNDAQGHSSIPWAVRIAMWRAALRDHLRAALPADARYGGVLIALVIGDQRGIAQADWEVFRRTGISHLVSISGLHITMIAGVAGAAARALWRHSFGIDRARRLAGGRSLRLPLPLVWPAQQAGLVITVLAALAYGLVAGMQIPALRTVTMLTVAAVAL